MKNQPTMTKTAAYEQIIAKWNEKKDQNSCENDEANSIDEPKWTCFIFATITCIMDTVSETVFNVNGRIYYSYSTYSVRKIVIS